jgi:nitrite reductase/ring-hydroxylating ferredoxin subunit
MISSGAATLIAEIARAGAQCTTLPPAAYVDQALLDQETNALFRREWICVGRSDEVAQTGSYMACSVAGAPVLVTRQSGGNVAAFANVCAHRASVLVSGSGHAQMIRCPYHAWCYDLEGHLISAPRMGKGFDPAGRGLVRLSAAEWHGFLFVSLDPDADPPAGRLAELSKALEPYQPGLMRTMRRAQYRWRCNWKILVENGMEAYHLSATHPKTLAPIAPVSRVRAEDGPIDYFFYRSGMAAGTAVPPFDATLRPLIAQPDTALVDEAIVAAVFPSLVLSIAADWIWWIAMQPDGVDHVLIEHGLSAPFDITPDEALPTHPSFYFLDLAEAFNEEDRLRTEAVQRGAESGFGRTAPLSPLEIGTQRFAKYLADRLGFENMLDPHTDCRATAEEGAA